MRPNYYGTAVATAASLTIFPAQTINAIAVHLPNPAMVGGQLLPAGNYTVSAVRGAGVAPNLRFQPEFGETINVMARREYLPMDDVSPKSEVLVEGGENDGALRVVKVAMQGDPFVFVVTDLGD